MIQLAWVEHFGKTLFGIDKFLHAFSHLEVVKFVKIIRPGEELKLTLNWFSKNGELAFKFTSINGVSQFRPDGIQNTPDGLNRFRHEKLSNYSGIQP